MTPKYNFHLPPFDTATNFGEEELGNGWELRRGQSREGPLLSRRRCRNVGLQTQMSWGYGRGWPRPLHTVRKRNLAHNPVHTGERHWLNLR